MPTLSRTKVLALLALPAGAIGYFVTVSILSDMALPDGARDLLMLFVPLFVAGLCMAAFMLPLFDQMAKRDLATIRAQRAAETEAGPDNDRPTGD